MTLHCLVKIIMSTNIFTLQHLTLLNQKRNKSVVAHDLYYIISHIISPSLRFLSGFLEAPLILVLVYAIATCSTPYDSHSDCVWHSLGPTSSSTSPCMPEYHRYYHQQEAWGYVSKPVQLLKCQVWMHCWESSHTWNVNYAALKAVFRLTVSFVPLSSEHKQMRSHYWKCKII